MKREVNLTQMNVFIFKKIRHRHQFVNLQYVCRIRNTHIFQLSYNIPIKLLGIGVCGDGSGGVLLCDNVTFACSRNVEIKFASKNVLSLKFMRNSKRNHKIRLRKGQEFMQIELSNAYESMCVFAYRYIEMAHTM